MTTARASFSSRLVTDPMKRITLAWLAGLFGVLSLSPALLAQTSVLTGRNDYARDGLYPNETYLTPANVNSTTFGNLFSYPVEGYVSAQPLFLPNVSIGGVNHNVVYVATENNNVYAFDADSAQNNPNPLWQVNVTPPNTIGPVPISMQECGSVTGLANIGIMGTPVIDPSTNTMYFVAKGEVTDTQASFWLYAMDVTSGALKFGAPTQITASVSTINGTVNFTPTSQLQRPALLLSNGNVFLSFGSNGCDQKDHGWLMAYNAATLQQSGLFITTPDVVQGGAIWMSGGGPALDGNGYIYLATANGDFDINTGGSDYGDTVVKLQMGSSGLSVVDYFTPDDQLNMNTNDLDLGSGGVMLLPSPQQGQYPDLLIAAGKTGTIYLIDTDNMGKYQTGNNDQIPQYVTSALLQEYGTAAFWNDTVYFSAHNDFLKAYSLSQQGTPPFTTLSTTPIAQSSTHYQVVGVPVISANQNTNGVLWLVRNTTANGPYGMYAYNATPTGSQLNQLYYTDPKSLRDALGTTAHFATPIIVNGKVYVGTQTNLMVYGLLPSIAISAGNNQSATVGSTLPTSLSVQVTDSYLHQPVAGVSIAFSALGGKGTFNPPAATTDSNGMASTQYTLPTASGTITISATNLHAVSATFTETATAGSPTNLYDISGGYQSATVGTALPNPLVVRLKDTYGNGVPNIPVSFSDGNQNGSFNPPSPVTTDPTGTVTVTYTVPNKAESLTITPSYNSLSGKFSEKSVAGPAASVSVISGNNQTGAPRTQLPKSLVAGVKDQYGNPVSGVTVTFSDGGAKGTFSTTTPVTSAQGTVTVTYTLPNSGPETINITGTVSSFVAQFTENVN